MINYNNKFNYLNINDNTQITELTTDELNMFLYHLSNYSLEIRKILNIDSKITFGTEIEVSTIYDSIIKKNIYKLFPNWNIEYEYSVVSGIEIQSDILTDNHVTWENFKKIFSILKKYAVINYECGGHIHIGTQILGKNNEYWLNFIKLWSVYENIIYRFGYGDFRTERPRINDFAKPLAKQLWEDYIFIKENNEIDTIKFLETKEETKFNAIHFKKSYTTNKIEKDNTIEFRTPNASLNPIIWQNNINFFIKLLNYCKSSNFNHDIINKRKINNDNFEDLELYREIYLEQALELCDLIFDNNLDKIYFLKQYFKDFKIGIKQLEKSKTFTKK